MPIKESSSRVAMLTFLLGAVAACLISGHASHAAPALPGEPVQGPVLPAAAAKAGAAGLKVHLGRAARLDAPPKGPVVSPAEFERAGVIIAYPHSIFTLDMIKEMAEGATVYCLVYPSWRKDAVDAFVGAGVDTSNVKLLERRWNTLWTRDYSPWMIFDGENRPGLVDFWYSTDRPADDSLHHFLGKALGIPSYRVDLYHQGGNYMSDGMGAAFSTTDVVKVNQGRGIAPDTLRKWMGSFLGLRELHLVEDPSGFGIHHVDTFAKLLAPDKVMILRYPRGHKNHGEMEAFAESFRKRISSYGTPYRVFRVDVAQGESYINSLILNDKVFLPFSGTAQDSAAVAAYRRAMPGYKVVGFTAKSPDKEPWLADASLHCLTSHLTDPGALRITHVPLRDTLAPAEGGYKVEASLVAHSGQGLIAESLSVYFKRPQDSLFTRAPLLPVPGGAPRYRAWIPAQARATDIHYYIHAADRSRRSENHPFIGKADPHRFHAAAPPVAAVPGAEPRTWPSRLEDLRGGDFRGTDRLALFDVHGRKRLELAGADPMDLHRRFRAGMDGIREGFYVLKLMQGSRHRLLVFSHRL